MNLQISCWVSVTHSHDPELSSSWESLLRHGFKNTEMSHYIWNGQEKYTACQSGRHLTKDLEWGVGRYGIFKYIKVHFPNCHVRIWGLGWKSYLIWGLEEVDVKDGDNTE